MNELGLTLEDLDNWDWQQARADAGNRECVAYAECFRAHKEKAGAANNERAQRVFELMERVCSFGFACSA